ncbi:x-pro dipeptidyl-peptidase [Phialemonium atrogriseum]|uniref:X-pro dipeptidyl-peptidase n=1 Tax=Phialemonium atrogriseum TaxID=1093897 RepID=A0AAJ0CB08_9PEZI|nr:x-pro dipeptidyl-peptidase [Phialemonium atrogriseum]KAK1771982.1 x-pro dipeptidyl-peptidase [Phialemonium atrogriseum]
MQAHSPPSNQYLPPSGMMGTGGGLDDWCDVTTELDGIRSAHSPGEPLSRISAEESMRERIIQITADEKDLLAFYNISLSKTRQAALRGFYSDELAGLETLSFEQFSQEDNVDYLLLKNYLGRNIRRLELEARRYAGISPFFPFAEAIIALCEAHQQVLIPDLEPKDTRMSAFRAVCAIKELGKHLDEFSGFFKGYDPLFDWWVTSPFEEFQQAASKLASGIQTKLLSGDGDDDAIGREGHLAELEAQLIPYTPEKLLAIARREYAWCETEMKKASRELGFDDNWRAALEHIKTLHTPPGAQACLVKHLIDESASHVKHASLVTVPPTSAPTSPFFLGGPTIHVAYPTSSTAHAAKTSSMRTPNNRAFARATAPPRDGPGPSLPAAAVRRRRGTPPHRRARSGRPFYVQGELGPVRTGRWVLWGRRGDFFVSAADCVGTLAVLAHAPLRFHLGEMAARECVDLLVDMVGHERATAEGGGAEVARRRLWPAVSGCVLAWGAAAAALRS